MNMKYLLACGVAAVSIGTAMADPKPTVFPHGIAGSSNVMTSAGAVQGTLSDTVTKADGSVQQTDGNVSGGYAKLNNNGQVTVPLIGDSTQSAFSFYVYPIASVKIIAGGAGYKTGDIVTDNGGYQVQISSVDSNGGATGITPITTYTLNGSTSLLRAASTSGAGYNLAYEFAYNSPISVNNNTLSAIFGHSDKLNDYGVALDGNDNTTTLKNLLLGIQNNQIYRANSSITNIDVTSGGYNALKNILIIDPHGTHNYYGDGTLLETLDEGVTLRRYVEKNTNWVANQLSSLTYGDTTTRTSNQSNQWIQLITGKDHAGNIVNSTGFLTNIRSDVQDYSSKDASNGEVNIDATTYRYGTDWQWAYLGVMQEEAPDPFVFHNTQEYMSEFDWANSGQDGGQDGNVRNGLLFSGYQDGNGFNTEWAASHVYSSGNEIEITVNGRLCSATAISSGTSAATEPDWDTLAMDDSAFVTAAGHGNLSTLPMLTDGTVTWRFNGLMRSSIDNSVVVSYQPDSNHAQDSDAPANKYGARTPLVYHSIVRTDALFDDALLNFANAQFLNSATPVTLRVPSETFLDLSASYNDKSKNNLHLLGYSAAAQALLYKTNGSVVFFVTDQGGISTSAESHFSDQTFTDPDSGTARSVKIGGHGLAVSGGTKTDSLKISSLSGTGNAYACIDSNGNLYRSATSCVAN